MLPSHSHPCRASELLGARALRQGSIFSLLVSPPEWLPLNPFSTEDTIQACELPVSVIPKPPIWPSGLDLVANTITQVSPAGPTTDRWTNQ